MRYGSTLSPKFANVEYAADISSGETPSAPSVMDGYGGRGEVMPSLCAISATGSAPIVSTTRAYTVFTELYVADSRVLTFFSEAPPAFATIHTFPSDEHGESHSIVAGEESSQYDPSVIGVSFRSPDSSAAESVNGLNAEPGCRAPWEARS